MADIEIPVLCYWNGCVKYGPDGVYYEGPTPTKISVKRSLKFSGLMDQLYGLTGLDRQRSKFDIAGRYPSVVQKSIKYVPLHVVNDTILETMLEVPSNHPCIKNVELYLEVKTCGDVIDLTGYSPLSANLGGSLKRQRTEHPSCKGEDNGTTHGEMMDKSSGSDGMALAVNLAANNVNVRNACLNNGASSSASKSLVSSLWIDDHELRVGLCFKDRDELKKAVDWCNIRERRKCVVEENEKDDYRFECIRWKCNWSLCAAKMEEHGLVEITKCSSPHTCCGISMKKFPVEFAAEEIESVIRVQPTLTVYELENWWSEKYSYQFTASVLKAAKLVAMKSIYRDWDQSFNVLPKLMAALQSSNGLVVDWQCDVFPNPKFASFRGVFWAFAQSIEGFTHCRPVIEVNTKDLCGKYPLKLMIASGFDAADNYFPLAFAVTKEVSTDSWRWFLRGIREKVTQRKELCLISSPDPDILTVINEPDSLWKEPWAYHRFSLDDLCPQFYGIYRNNYLTDLVEKAGLAMQQVEFDSHMETIRKKNPEARQWLDQMPPHQWALAHVGGQRYVVDGIDTLDLFSSCKNLESPDLPLTATVLILFDVIRSLFCKGVTYSKGILMNGHVYTEQFMEKLEESMSASVTHSITPLDNGVFQVTKSLEKEEWTVQLNECTCSCGEFQTKKYPCVHALAVCEKLKTNPLQYVDECYSLDRYCKTYAATFSPVPEVSAWPEASDVPTLFPPPLAPNESVEEEEGDEEEEEETETETETEEDEDEEEEQE